MLAVQVLERIQGFSRRADQRRIPSLVDILIFENAPFTEPPEHAGKIARIAAGFDTAMRQFVGQGLQLDFHTRGCHLAQRLNDVHAIHVEKNAFREERMGGGQIALKGQ